MMRNTVIISEAEQCWTHYAASDHDVDGATRMATPYIPYEGEIVTRDAAKAAGATRYFNGQDKPCKNGHISQRHSNTGSCITCHGIRQDKWDAANAEKIREANRANYARNAPDKRAAQKRFRDKKSPGYHAERHAKWYSENQERARAQSREYYYANRETIQDARRFENLSDDAKSVILKRAKDYRIENPEAHAAHERNRRARKRSAEGRHDASDIKALFDKQRGKCAHSWCRKSLKEGYHVDHIIPLALGGSNWPRNLQLLCEHCNCSKNAKHPIEHAQQHGMLL